MFKSTPRNDNFDKPIHPKKNWIQKYLEKNNPGIIKTNFKDNIDKTYEKNGRSVEPSSAENKGLAIMSTSFTCGVNKSNNDIARHVPPAAVEAPKMSEQGISGIAQTIVGQFLNGSLAYVGYRKSRKRSEDEHPCSSKRACYE